MSAAADKSTIGTTLSLTDIGVSLLVVLTFSFSLMFFSDIYVEPPGNGYNFTLIFYQIKAAITIVRAKIFYLFFYFNIKP